MYAYTYICANYKKTKTRSSLGTGIPQYSARAMRVIHTCIYTYIHTYIHTHIHTYIHTHTHNRGWCDNDPPFLGVPGIDGARYRAELASTIIGLRATNRRETLTHHVNLEAASLRSEGDGGRVKNSFGAI